MHTISEERQLIEERTGAKVREFGQIFSLNPDVADIADNYATRYAGVDLLVLGAAQRAGSGCACPESVLLKSLVRELVLRRDEVVILDMEAGIEHLGRGTAMGVDVMIAVVEPGQRSVETAHRVREMAAGIGITRFAVVLNKSTAPAEDQALDRRGVRRGDPARHHPLRSRASPWPIARNALARPGGGRSAAALSRNSAATR